MSARRVLGGTAVVLALLWMSTGTAAGGDTYPIEPPPTVAGEQETPDDEADDDGAVGESPAVQGDNVTRDGALPFTGTEVLGLVLVAIALVGAGAILLRWRRRRVA